MIDLIYQLGVYMKDLLEKKLTPLKDVKVNKLGNLHFGRKYSECLLERYIINQSNSEIHILVYKKRSKTEIKELDGALPGI